MEKRSEMEKMIEMEIGKRWRKGVKERDGEKE